MNPPPRAGASHATIFPYGPFAVGDGSSVMLGVQNEREWQAFCVQVLQMPDLAAHPDYARNAARNAARDPLRRLIEDCFARLDAATVTERLALARIAHARVNDLADLWAHPQLQARNRWRTVGSPAGDIPALLPPRVTRSAPPNWRRLSRSITARNHPKIFGASSMRIVTAKRVKARRTPPMSRNEAIPTS